MDGIRPFPSVLKHKQCTTDSEPKAQNHSNLDHVFQRRLSDYEYSQYLEAAFSPAKYAIFSTFGSLLLSFSGVLHSRTTLSAKVGCIGGTVLTIVYMVLLLSRTEGDKGDGKNGKETPQTTRQTASIVMDEIFYSAFASGIGSVVCIMTSHPVDSFSQMVAGALGPPLVALMCGVCLGVLFVALNLYWRISDWYIAYRMRR
ncbi:hypothetical protein FA15DRAFT_635582 [Coprinopsis marcescibilis]|uniref:Uncharacterized protein n=1 Tax=Coprinopsis marcescibilis TaxID=230819 RepID=A0A5C3L415_COPMA|nr:hypothetical protein FA15DRAFT_635582 [Coprinopsis marcescibilis]